MIKTTFKYDQYKKPVYSICMIKIRILSETSILYLICHASVIPIAGLRL